MATAAYLLDALHQAGIRLLTGTPCSYLSDLFSLLDTTNRIKFVRAHNEGDALAIAAGAEIAGIKSAVVFQNSGLGNTVNALTSLAQAYRLPVLLLVTYRGAPDEAPDEPQHRLMGKITLPLLDLMEIPWTMLPAQQELIPAVLEETVLKMSSERRSHAVIIRKGQITGSTKESETKVAAQYPTRTDVIAAVKRAMPPSAVLLATTGYTARDLFSAGDAANNFYMVGSMGHVSALSLGVAQNSGDRFVVVLDGDGSLLMRLGNMALIGSERPRRFVHLMIDNGEYESTGGQKTIAPDVDFVSVAKACGYRHALDVNSENLEAALRHCFAVPENHFLRIKVRRGPVGAPTRPKIPLDQLAARFASVVRGPVTVGDGRTESAHSLSTTDR